MGLHSGKQTAVTLEPFDRQGIYFRGPRGLSSVSEARVEEDSRLTGFSLPNGVSVRTGEHLLAAIAGMGIDAAVVELDGGEVPIMDGSAFPFADGIKKTGLEETGDKCERLALPVPVYAEERGGDRIMTACPCDHLKVTYIIDYSGTPVGVQRVTVDVTTDNFYNIISKARTFGLTRELEYLKQNGLALGGTLDNALVFDENGPVGGQELRFPLECAMHKVIDLLGDLTLCGFVPVAHYIGIASGHSIHAKLTRRLRALFASARD